jgi:hypothetical protein
VSGYVGSDPTRVAALRRRVIAAIDHLQALHSDDPAAAAAVAAARGIGHELATAWLPLVDRLGDDTSMTGWRAVAGSTAPARPGSRAGTATSFETSLRPLATRRPPAVDDALSACADLLDGRGDPADAMQRLQTWLAAHRDDPALMRALLGALGVDGFADVLLMLGALEPADDAVATAIQVRDGLRFVGASDGFGAEALAEVLVARMVGDGVPTGTDAYALADFVTEGAGRPSGLDGALAVRLVACEQRFAERGAGAPAPGPWAIAPGGSNLTSVTSGPAWTPDPVTALLTDLAADPDEARAVLGDVATAEYLVRDRPYRDGFTALMGFVAGACAGPDLTNPQRPPGTATVHAANVAATRAVGWLAERTDLDPSAVSEPASLAAADVVVVHLLAASVAIERPPASTAISTAFLADPELATVDDESLGGLGAVEVATFGLDGLDRLTVMAAASDDGLLRLRAGLSGFQQRRADGTVALMLATGDPAVAQRRLDQALGESGHIEGYFIGTIGGALEGAARAADARTSFFITAAGTVVGMMARNVPLVPFFASGLPRVQNWMRDELARSSVAVAADLDTQATEAGSAVLYRYTVALVDAGLVPLPAGWPEGRLPPWAGLRSMPPNLVDELWNGASDPAPGAVVLDLDAVADAITLEQQDAYVRLP